MPGLRPVAIQSVIHPEPSYTFHMAILNTDRLTEQECKLCRIIESREHGLRADLTLHVGLPTGGRNTVALDETRALLTDRLKKLGASVEFVQGDPAPDWLYGRDPDDPVPPTAVSSRLREGQPRILLAGHLDTVHDPEGPFRELNIEPGGMRATGPGCVDMKGGLVIAVAALECLEEAGIDAGWSFLMNSDEETGSYHSDEALATQARKHDVGLAIEPALPGGALAIERMGSGQFCIQAHGKAAHVGRAFTEGISAVTALAKTIVKAARLPEPDAGKILNIGPIQGSNATNIVPDHAVAWGNVRFGNPAHAEALAQALDALASPGEGLPRIEVLRSFNRPAKPMLPETERLGLLARQVAEDIGQSLPFASTGGVCDGNQLQVVGLPTIDTLGVRGGGLHTPDEWIDMTSLVERCQLLAVLISRLSGGAWARQGG